MGRYYSPSGRCEIWEHKPQGYMTPEEWLAAHPAPEPEPPTPAEIIAEYDAALERKLADEKAARGYTVREPSDYLDSHVVRYRQDAQDWIAHRDLVMLEGLTMLNEYLQTGVIPSLNDFLAALPNITWTIDPTNSNLSEGMTLAA